MILPSDVSEIVEELKKEKTTKSIWLVGSRANGNAHKNSDWDLLVFSSKDPEPTKSRKDNIDVIIVGSNNKYLLEGQNQDYIGEFDTWYWQKTSDTEATYLNLTIKDVKPMEAIDGSTASRSSCLAKCLWQSKSA